MVILKYCDSVSSFTGCEYIIQLRTIYFIKGAQVGALVQKHFFCYACCYAEARSKQQWEEPPCLLILGNFQLVL